jgi:hypothetical protein
MNIAIPETPRAAWFKEAGGNGLIDIRKDEREKTLDEVISYIGEMSVMVSQRGVLERLKQKFLAPDPVEELAKELRELDIDNMLDREIAAYILDNYEIKKKPVNGV